MVASRLAHDSPPRVTAISTGWTIAPLLPYLPLPNYLDPPPPIPLPIPSTPSTPSTAAHGPHHYHGNTQATASSSPSSLPSSITTTPTTRPFPTTGSRPWNRDVCSAINIAHKAYGEAYGRMPECFTRSRRHRRNAPPTPPPDPPPT